MQRTFWVNVLLKKREADKEELEERVLSNLRELVLPHVEKLKQSRLDAAQKAHLNILESSLKGIVSPFSKKMSSKYPSLTPTEIQVANLVKAGKTTKEIADLTSLSIRTIEGHRKNVRRKIGIKNTRANLRTHILSMEQ